MKFVKSFNVKKFIGIVTLFLILFNIVMFTKLTTTHAQRTYFIPALNMRGSIPNQLHFLSLNKIHAIQNISNLGIDVSEYFNLHNRTGNIIYLHAMDINKRYEVNIAWNGEKISGNNFNKYNNAYLSDIGKKFEESYIKDTSLKVLEARFISIYRNSTEAFIVIDFKKIDDDSVTRYRRQYFTIHNSQGINIVLVSNNPLLYEHNILLKNIVDSIQFTR